MTWLDLLLLLILVTSVLSGWMSGLARVAIGFAALILAFLISAWFYGQVGAWLLPLIVNKLLANVMGFALVFGLVMLAGGLISRFIGVVFRLTGLSILDRLAGAAFGLVRGILACVVLVTALLSFAPARMVETVGHSRTSPYILEASHAISAATPYELKHAYQVGYDEARLALKEALQQRHKKKKPAGQ